MKKFMFMVAFLGLNILFHISCSSTKKNIIQTIAHNVPENKELYDAIVYNDSLFFDAYNHCHMDIMESMFAEDIEFYHDKGGLTTSKADILNALQQNICNKVTRELIKGSIEVYPIKGYGAVQMGQHRFYNKLENPTVPSRPGKFVTTWQNKDGKWSMTRIISLH
jgi:hypothetical protein